MHITCLPQEMLELVASFCAAKTTTALMHSSSYLHHALAHDEIWLRILLRDEMFPTLARARIQEHFPSHLMQAYWYAKSNWCLVSTHHRSIALQPFSLGHNCFSFVLQSLQVSCGICCPHQHTLYFCHLGCIKGKRVTVMNLHSAKVGDKITIQYNHLNKFVFSINDCLLCAIYLPCCSAMFPVVSQTANIATKSKRTTSVSTSTCPSILCR